MNKTCFTAKEATESGAFECAKSWQNFVEKMESEGKEPSPNAIKIAKLRLSKLSGEVTV